MFFMEAQNNTRRKAKYRRIFYAVHTVWRIIYHYDILNQKQSMSFKAELP